jgi:Na+/H+-translocating membrane pyrophosphatase
MNVLTSLVLYLSFFFVMIALALLNILPLNYLGGIIIGLFIAGLLYTWANAWRQAKKIIESPVEDRADEKKQEEPLTATA